MLAQPAASILAAAAGNDLESVKLMLERDICDINEVNARGTALCCAAANGNASMVSALMRKRKCNYHLCDEAKNTVRIYDEVLSSQQHARILLRTLIWQALHLACSKGHEAVVQVMVSHMKHTHDLDLSIKNEEGQTAYDVAQLNGHTECCELLGDELKKRYFMCFL